MTAREKLEEICFHTIPVNEEVQYELFVGSDIEVTLYTVSGSHHIPVRINYSDYCATYPKKRDTSDQIIQSLRDLVESVLFDRIVLLSSPQDGV